jgi:murein DD-endopeptidase MepM/ murein hydrolase activator NlpD
MRALSARLRATLCLALATLCVAGFATPVSADEGPTASAPPRAVPLARSYPRTFETYDALVSYASGVAAWQKAMNAELAALTAHDAVIAARLQAVYDPRARGGLIASRSDLMDDATAAMLRWELVTDGKNAARLVANGAVLQSPPAWHLPVIGELSQEFGPTGFWFEPALTFQGTYYPHFHTGVDIATAWGTPVFAPAPGTVVYAGTMGDGAEVVVIAHDGGLVSMYAHLDDRTFLPPVKAGDVLRGGERIGNIGMTGLTTGPHVHWSVWRDGELVDPLSIVAR